MLQSPSVLECSYFVARQLGLSLGQSRWLPNHRRGKASRAPGSPAQAGVCIEASNPRDQSYRDEGSFTSDGGSGAAVMSMKRGKGNHAITMPQGYMSIKSDAAFDDNQVSLAFLSLAGDRRIDPSSEPPPPSPK